MVWISPSERYERTLLGLSPEEGSAWLSRRQSKKDLEAQLPRELAGTAVLLA